MNRINLDVDDIVKLYKSGLSEKALAERLNVNRGTIRRRLVQSGVVCRGRSESAYLRMSSLTAEERQRLAGAAHDAIRGKKYTYEELVNRAKAKEGSVGKLSAYERELASELDARGIPFVPQKALGKYNLDFFVGDSVAFEIFGGNWHFYGDHARSFTERDEFIRDCGILPVYCVVAHRSFNAVAVCDYLVGVLDILRRDPSSIGEQNVIRGNGKLFPSTSFKLHDVA